MKNEMEIIFDGVAANESFARVAVAAFVTGQNPTMEEIMDIETAVSEAVTNAIIHGYEGVDNGKVRMNCVLEDGVLRILIADRGKGIADVPKAMEPLYTDRPEWDRSGMGFSFMEAFMDRLEVESAPGEGTRVHMEKRLWKK